MILCGRVIFLAYVVQEKQLELIFNAQEKLMRAILVSLCVNQCCYISALKSPLTLGQGSFCLLHRDFGSVALTF